MTGAKFHSLRGSKLDKDDILYICEIKTNDSVAVYKKILPSGFFCFQQNATINSCMPVILDDIIMRLHNPMFSKCEIYFLKHLRGTVMYT